MKEQLFMEKMAKLDEIRSRYEQLAAAEEYDGLEIIPVYGFLQETLDACVQISRDLEADHENRVKTLDSEFLRERNSVSAKYSQKTRALEAEMDRLISDHSGNADEKIEKLEKALETKLQELESVKNKQLEEINKEQASMAEIYRSIKEPSACKFNIKSNRKLYTEKYEECQRAYALLESGLADMISGIEREYQSNVEACQSIAARRIAAYQKESDSFQKEQQDSLQAEIQRLNAKQKEETDQLTERNRKEKEEEKTQYYQQMAAEKQAVLELAHSFLTDEALLSRIQTWKDRKFDFSNYKVAEGMPELVDQGYLCGRISEETVKSVPQDILDQIWEWIAVFNCGEEPYSVKLPYIRKANAGINYFLAMDTRTQMDYIRSVVFSVLMQYPVGKVNLIMIDPMASGCFGGLVRLGIKDPSLVDTKVWYTESDIESAMTRFSHKLNEIVNHYGRAVERCLAAENRTLIAIADFPQSYSLKALRELSLILDNGPRYGVNFIIAQNDDEMAVKMDDPEYNDLIARIVQKMNVFTDSHGAVGYMAACGDKEFLLTQTADSETILNQDMDIVDKMYQYLADGK